MPAGKLTRSQVEDVLRRAAQLEAERLGRGPADGNGDDREEDGSEAGLGEMDLFRLGVEAGLSEDALRDALVEQRSGGLAQRQSAGFDRALGALGDRQLVVSRVVPGPAPPIARAVERFLRAQLMTVRRHHGERIEWQRARGLWPGLVRSLAFARQFAFGPVSRVETRVVARGDAETQVSFRIDLAEWRRDRMLRALGRAATAFGVFGLGGAWLFTGFGLPDVLALLSGGGLAGGLVALERRRFRESREEVAVAPEKFLDLLVLRRAKSLTAGPKAPRARLAADAADDEGADPAAEGEGEESKD